ncbi:MAG TPA: pyridoxamine 5'-phosphate oxidase family protein [Actinomycetes bacterium]|jgi:uncharacterized protein YhbP (UPF0306 family)|nr:pyridoxamine 5'-phosphate oxidase family protein [Actinomycetes bacterium]
MTTPERRLLEEYVTQGKLMQVATLDEHRSPALCHVWYRPAFRPDRLYFISRWDRDHSVNIRRDGQVAGGIVAMPLEGLGQKVRGVTFKGHAIELPKSNVEAELEGFFTRWPSARDVLTAERLGRGETPSRLYCITVSEWVLFDEEHFPQQPRRILEPEQ